MGMAGCSYHAAAKSGLATGAADNYSRSAISDEASSYSSAQNGKMEYNYSETSRDTKLEAAITSTYDLPKGQTVRYLYNRMDLNGDGTLGVFVDLISDGFIGTGGSSAAIYETVDGACQLVSRFTLVNTPVIVSNHTTNGWKDLVFPVCGGESGPLMRY